MKTKDLIYAPGLLVGGWDAQIRNNYFLEIKLRNGNVIRIKLNLN